MKKWLVGFLLLILVRISSAGNNVDSFVIEMENSDYKNIIEAQRYSQLQDNRREYEKKLEKKIQERNQKKANFQKSFLISSNDTICVVSEKLTGKCIVNNFEFNTFISMYDVSDSIDIDSFKTEVMICLLQEKYIEMLQLKSGFSSLNIIADSLECKNNIVWMQEAKVITSTDSIYLTKEIQNIQSENRTAILKCFSLYDLSKADISSGIKCKLLTIIPSALNILTNNILDTTNNTDWTDPFRTNIGYMSIKKKYMKNCCPSLSYGISLAKELRKTIEESEIKSYFIENKSKLERRDTLNLKIWTIPNIIYNKENQKYVDTNGVIPLLVTDYDLPEKLRYLILTTYKEKKQLVFENVAFDYGVYTVKIVKEVKSKPWGFNELRSRIIDEIVSKKIFEMTSIVKKKQHEKDRSIFRNELIVKMIDSCNSFALGSQIDNSYNDKYMMVINVLREKTIDWVKSSLNIELH